jgi:hypothetical protein
MVKFIAHKIKMKIIFTSVLLHKVCIFVMEEILLYSICMNDGSHTKFEGVQNMYKYHWDIIRLQLSYDFCIILISFFNINQWIFRTQI